MAKQRRAVKTPAKSIRRVKRAQRTKKQDTKKSVRKAVAANSRPHVVAQKSQSAPVPAPPPPEPAPPRKPGFYEAVAIYERGVQALQKHDFAGAAGFFRTVLERYPDERELLERARLYLRVCERETSRQPAPGPKTPAERVYAATVALNSGDHNGALDHLQRALGEDPESDHAHYIMAVALGMRNRGDEAIGHLQQAIALNPENRGLAKQDPDLDSLRDHERFRDALDTPPAPNRRRPVRRQ
jgi:tetratricopeptide (TPR) repeat protein